MYSCYTTMKRTCIELMLMEVDDLIGQLLGYKTWQLLGYKTWQATSRIQMKFFFYSFMPQIVCFIAKLFKLPRVSEKGAT